MAIRLQQIAAPNFASSNALALAANQQIGNALQGLQSTLGQYRDDVVKRNTAQAVGLLTGATDANDLAQRQQQVAQLVQQGDIDPTRVSEVAATMPDTLLGRQTNQLKLNQIQTAQHDAPLMGQYMQAIMSGDQNTAKGLLSQFQGDASDALKFASDWDIKNQQLNLQRSELAQRQAQFAATQAAARAKAGQGNALLKALPGLLNVGNVVQGKSEARDLQANTQEAQQRLAMDPINNPKLDIAGWADANNDAWFGKGTSNYIYNALKDQPAFKALNPQQQKSVLDGALANDANRPGDVSLKNYATKYLTDATTRLNELKIGARQAEDAQDRQSVMQAQRDRLNNLLLPLLLQQQ
ncbi:hypothetical protein ACUND2_22355 [Serratia sp. IR-2025]